MGRKPNYGYEKRQKELARKAKKEEKKKRRAEEEQDGEPSPDSGQDSADEPETD